MIRTIAFKQGWAISVAFLILFLVPILPFLNRSLYAGSTARALDKNFKALGIIKLPGIQAPADDILLDLNGNRSLLSDYKGKIVFLNFWTTWCPDCTREMPDIEKLHRKLVHTDFVILALDLRESKTKVARFVRKHGLTFKVLLDQKGKMGRSFGIRSIPTTFILSRKGNLIGKAMGARNWTGKDSIRLFTNLLEETE